MTIHNHKNSSGRYAMKNKEQWMAYSYGIDNPLLLLNLFIFLSSRVSRNPLQYVSSIRRRLERHSSAYR